MRKIAPLALILFGLSAVGSITYADSKTTTTKTTKTQAQKAEEKSGEKNHNKKTSMCLSGYRGCYGSVEGGA